VPICDNHPELDRRMRECEAAAVITMQDHSAVKLLFEYNDAKGELLGAIQLKVNTIHVNQFNSMNMLADIRASMQELVRDFKIVQKDNEDFAWFREQMNWINGRIWRWLVGAAAICLLILVASHSDVAKQLWKAVVKE